MKTIKSGPVSLRNSPLSRQWTKCIERQQALISIKFTFFGSISINDFINLFDAFCVIELFYSIELNMKMNLKQYNRGKNAWFCFCRIFVQSQASGSLCKPRLDIVTPLPCCKWLCLTMSILAIEAQRVYYKVLFLV